jgi:hypothetical protein
MLFFTAGQDSFRTETVREPYEGVRLPSAPIVTRLKADINPSTVSQHGT